MLRLEDKTSNQDNFDNVEMGVPFASVSSVYSWRSEPWCFDHFYECALRMLFACVPMELTRNAACMFPSYRTKSDNA